ncbi:LysR family transcriptional regulator [Acidimangrovimonas sediminis]|uniref:LysR family transcriptional regulator n=1 Tax=Acidimangrovimonas sediminis TaxID=2056283 RepID=UPI001E4D4B40|nr:LysR family transcriptional regulator [Acidimangrovimonas sediminis]
MAEHLTNLRPVQARLIAAIAAHGQLQIAAQSCQITQPAASRMLAELERMIGVPLFERTPKGMEPTPAGALVARRAERVVLELNDMAREMRDFREGRSGRVRVGAVTGPALGYVVPAIRALKQEAPGVEISVEVGPSTALVPALARGDLDFALARIPPDHDSADFEVEPARHEVGTLLVRAGHPMAGRGAVVLPDLAGFPWILQQRGAPIRTAVDAAFAAAGCPAPRDVTTTSSLLVIIALLADTDSIAAMSREVTNLVLSERVGARFARLPLHDPLEIDPYLLLRARHRVLPPVAMQLLALHRSFLARPDPGT